MNLHDNITAALLVLHVNERAYALTGGMIRRLVYATTGRGANNTGGWSVGFNRKRGGDTTIADDGRFPRSAPLWTSTGQPRVRGRPTFVLTNAGRARVAEMLTHASLDTFDAMAWIDAKALVPYERARADVATAAAKAKAATRASKAKAKRGDNDVIAGNAARKGVPQWAVNDAGERTRGTGMNPVGAHASVTIPSCANTGEPTTSCGCASCDPAVAQQDDAFDGIASLVHVLQEQHGVTRHEAITLLRAACDVVDEAHDEDDADDVHAFDA